MTIDLYLLRLALGRCLGITLVIVTVLSLENLPVVIRRLAGFDEGGLLVLRAVFDLLPEYAGVALPIGIFLASALTFRRLGMDGELDVIAASGRSDRRLLRAPYAMAAVAALLLVGLRFWVQPAGERALDRIGISASQGVFGYVLKPGVPNLLGPRTQFYFDAVDSESGALSGILVRQPRLVLAAPAATLDRLPQGDVVLSSRDAVLVWPTAKGLRRADFRAFRMRLPLRLRPPSETLPPHEQLDRADLGQLIERAAASDGGSGVAPALAVAAIAGRVADILFCLLLPGFGFALGVPAKRSRSAVGLAIGFVIILLFWRLSALIQDHFALGAPLLLALLLIVAAMAAVRLLGIQRRHGLGAIEHRLGRIQSWAVRRIRRASALEMVAAAATS